MTARTLPPRHTDRKQQWKVGDVVMIGRARWIIRIITPAGEVELESSNLPASAAWWATTLDRLPKKG